MLRYFRPLVLYTKVFNHFVHFFISCLDWSVSIFHIPPSSFCTFSCICVSRCNRLAFPLKEFPHDLSFRSSLCPCLITHTLTLSRTLMVGPDERRKNRSVCEEVEYLSAVDWRFFRGGERENIPLSFRKISASNLQHSSSVTSGLITRLRV